VGEKILQLSISHAERKSSGVPRLSVALEKKAGALGCGDSDQSFEQIHFFVEELVIH